MTLDPVVVLVARFALGWLFLFGALHKLRDMPGFVRTLGAYRLVPEWLLAPGAWAIAALEVVLGVTALIQLEVAFVAGMALLLAYASAMGINLVRGRRFIDCGCGGDRQPISVALIVRNLVLAGVAWMALLPSVGRPLDWVDGVSVAGGVLVCGLLYGAVNQVLAAQARLEEWV
jgi:uncharacterized membrane protein YphA (DoxX/SURF4 family)